MGQRAKGLLIDSEIKTCGLPKQFEPRHGKLIYVMGPSAVGKDALLKAVKPLLGEGFFFPMRYITRPATIGEEHIPLTELQFQELLKQSHFVLYWRSHDLWYGIDGEMEEKMRSGRQVVVNGSREHFYQALERFPTLTGILITSSKEIIWRRLISRGREDYGEVLERWNRARRDFNLGCGAHQNKALVFDNSEDLSKTSLDFAQLLKNI
jgi:ribose 1,5-bisphosphokinase